MFFSKALKAFILWDWLVYIESAHDEHAFWGSLSSLLGFLTAGGSKHWLVSGLATHLHAGRFFEVAPYGGHCIPLF